MKRRQTQEQKLLDAGRTPAVSRDRQPRGAIVKCATCDLPPPCYVSDPTAPCCACVACPNCSAPAMRAPLEVSETLAHVCACGWRGDRCECGAIKTFDPVMRGETCGGLQLVGWAVCACGATPTITKRARPADALEWKLAKGGRSLTAGAIKVRAEAGNGRDIEAVMARIVRVPELEIELEELREMLREARKAP